FFLPLNLWLQLNPVLALALEPQPRVPIRAALVDHWLVEDGDLLVAVLPLLECQISLVRYSGFQ
ncbi:MAG: hypothetical protein VYD85_12565, partial [Pseudomonadota bacterium]|nr:hypothetical protein [Pseudomonadota bacterium]